MIGLTGGLLALLAVRAPPLLLGAKRARCEVGGSHFLRQSLGSVPGLPDVRLERITAPPRPHLLTIAVKLGPDGRIKGNGFQGHPLVTPAPLQAVIAARGMGRSPPWYLCGKCK